MENPTEGLYHFETLLWAEGINGILGLDEVGRGCLAGPVVAAGVILNQSKPIDGLNDSKVLTAEERVEIARNIKENAFYCTIRECDVDEIDRLNIYWASIVAMEKCVNKSLPHAEYLLVDGKQYPSVPIPGKCLIKGDSRSASIAAASILAKVYRDELMYNLHQQLPFFGWDTNVGYPTRKHYSGLEEYGITSHHRRSFKLGTKKEYQV